MAEEAEDEGADEEEKERKELNEKVTLELPAGRVDHCLVVAEEKMPGDEVQDKVSSRETLEMI